MYLRNRMGSGWGEGIRVRGEVIEITGEKTQTKLNLILISWLCVLKHVRLSGMLLYSGGFKSCVKEKETFYS